MGDSVSYRINGSVIIDEVKLIQSPEFQRQMAASERIARRLGLLLEKDTDMPQKATRSDYSDDT
jgi:hypothetical protein